MSEDDDGDNKEPENVDEALNSVNCLVLFNDVTHLGELRGLPIADESRLHDKVRFKFVLLTASVFSINNKIVLSVRLRHVCL